jgi:hypothetical protein
MRTQVCLASTAFGLATLSAAADDAVFAESTRRVLVLSNNAAIPETAYGVADVAGIGPLIDAFDDVYAYNDAVAPQHPSTWQPRPADLPIWERSLRQLWALEGDLHLVVESIQVNPALALCQTFADATIDVYADGLMSYGPTRNALPAQVGTRVERVLHLDLVPGVRPLLLREYGVQPVEITTESFHKVMAAIGAESGSSPLSTSGGPTAVLLGQYLSALQLMTDEEERQLHVRMVEGAVAAGFRELVFKAHPGAPAGLTAPLIRRAEELGARLTVRETPELVETWYASGEVDLVVGCFSTALATAALYGVPAARIGTELLLERLSPYENSNRIAAAVIATTVPPLAGTPDAADSTSSRPLTPEQVVTTVGYLMQPTRNPELRSAAARLLKQRFADLRPFVRRQRLGVLGLPGGHAPGITTRLGPSGPILKRLLGPTLSRRMGDAARHAVRLGQRFRAR